MKDYQLLLKVCKVLLQSLKYNVKLTKHIRENKHDKKERKLKNGLISMGDGVDFDGSLFSF